MILIIFISVVECPAFKAPQHGSRDGDQVVYQTKVTFTCFPGYEMQGNNEITCQADGRWSGSVPTCFGNNLCKFILIGAKLYIQLDISCSLISLILF